jgi:galactokinase
MNLAQLSQESSDQFAKRFGRLPAWIVAAPGRVNLIGEHTDYNDGFVLPMAIERWTVIAAGPGAQPQLTLHSQALNSTVVLDLTKPMQTGEPKWANYVRGVVAGFQQQGTPLEGVDAVMNSTVPLGSGLSSSAALEVATATLLEAVTGYRLDPVEKALLCQRAEHQFAGVPCGIMDQFTSTLAQENHLLLVDCRSREVELVPLSDPSRAVLVINTNVKHELTGGEYAKRRAQCETAAKALGLPSLREATLGTLRAAQSRIDPVVFRRAHHVITEIERTVAAARAITASQWAKVGELMYASHASLRGDYEVSCSELDAVVEIAQAIGLGGGVIGCRMTGGGFGGCAVALVESAKVEFIMRQLGQKYRERTGIEASTFVSHPANGAAVLKQP